MPQINNIIIDDILLSIFLILIINDYFNIVEQVDDNIDVFNNSILIV
jgi:hypothetical protein